MAAGFSIVITTTNTQESADRIVAAVMKDRLAACVQIFPVVSHYIWKDALQKDDEIQLQMKIRTADYEALAGAIRAVHPYETPEIVRLDIADGDRAYLDWIDSVTRAR